MKIILIQKNIIILNIFNKNILILNVKKTFKHFSLIGSQSFDFSIYFYNWIFPSLYGHMVILISERPPTSIHFN